MRKRLLAEQFFASQIVRGCESAPIFRHRDNAFGYFDKSEQSRGVKYGQQVIDSESQSSSQIGDWFSPVPLDKKLDQYSS